MYYAEWINGDITGDIHAISCRGGESDFDNGLGSP